MKKTEVWAAAWLRQATNDVAFARAALNDSFFSQVCFLAQQAAEKAIKSMYLLRGKAFPFSHSLTELCQGLRINGRLLQAAAVLDQYYVTGRYPSGAGSLAPFEMFRDFQAIEAIELAVRFLNAAKKRPARKRTTARRAK